MDDLASRSNGDACDEQPTSSIRSNRSRKIRRIYLLVSVVLIALYPFLPPPGRDTVFLVASWTATAGVLVGLRRVGPGKRRVWVLLLAALVVLNIADASAVVLPGDLVVTDTSLPDAAGYLLLLAATLALVMQQRRRNHGSIIDTSIAALALGGVLWDLVLSPNLVAQYQEGSAKLAICVVVFALCGVVGALAQLDIQRPAATALRPLIAAVTLALAGNMVVAMTIEPWLTTAAAMMFMGAYAGVGLFGLNPAASEFVTSAPLRADKLSLGRLVFLGIAVAVVPFVVGVRQLVGGGPDALVLVISSVTIAALVMVRIGQLSAQRDEAEQALLHEATHDSLTGLLDRKEFVAGVSDELARDHNIAILYLDLNRFKDVNDRFGHANGDKVLIEAAQRIRDSVRADDVVSRFGGDEFVILLRHTSPDEVETIKQRIIDALARPIPVSSELVTVGASIGSALATGDEADPEDLIIRADHAMYAAKSDATAAQEQAPAPGQRISFAPRRGRRLDGVMTDFSSWDAMYRDQRPPWDIGRPQEAFVRLADAGEMNPPVLDSGCGTGEHTLLLAERGMEVLGIDAAPAAVNLARAKAAQRGLDAEFEVGDVLALDRLGRTFATVIDCGVFHVFDDADRARYVASLASAVDAGGVLHLLCFSERTPGTTGPRRVTQGELRTAFEEGWTVERIEPAHLEVREEYAPEPAHGWLAKIVRSP